MSYIKTTFLGSEYTIPADILLYIDLLDFTSSIKSRLTNTFVRKLKGEIQKGKAYVSDQDLAPELEQQIGLFIAKLTEHDIYDRTVSDYLRQNEGYKLISKINATAYEDSQREYDRQMSDWREGHESAIQKKDASVTGLGFSIWSSSFINHAIYAAMEASKVNEQEKAAAREYEKEMAELNARLKSRKATHVKWYTETIYIPKMEAAITVFSYELLDTFISDLIKYGKLNKEVLNYVHIDRSNDLLKNLDLSQNKPAVLLKAFEACPYNIAVYMQAIKHDLLDHNSFQTAKVFKQDHLILSFFKENWGKVSFPTTFKINYHCVNVWASLIDRQPSELLRALTAQYAKDIVQAYATVADMLTNKQHCRKIMEDCGEDEILKGDAICKTKAYTYVSTIVSPGIWSQLVEKCGHTDLLDRIKGCIPSSVTVSSKNEIDKYLVRALFDVFANERRFLVDEIEKQKELKVRKKAEQERLERERKKRNIKIAAIITPIIAIVIAFVFVLNTVIIPSNKYKQAISLQDSGDYRAAIELYNALGDYNDAAERCIDLWGTITFRETISAEYRHTVALKSNGTVVAVGDDYYGRTDVSEWTDIIAISAGVNYTLGLKSDGTVLAVGADDDGKSEVENWKGIVAIAAGTNHSVGLKSDGTVVAAGSNSDDECEVSDWTNIIAIAVGDSHTVGLKADGTAVATGGTKYGRCDVEDWTNLVAIAAADEYTLGLKSDGTVVAVGTGGHSLTIGYVESWTDIVAISASDNHILGLKSDGTVVVTGENDEGQCNVSSWQNIVAVAAGYEHSVGLMEDGTVIATGSNEYGQCNVSKWKDIKLPLDAELQHENESAATAVEYDEYLTWYNVEFASSFLGKELNADGSLSMGPGDYEAISNDMYLFDLPGRFSHGWSSVDADPIVVDILDWITTKSVDNFNNILNPLIERYGDDYRVQYYDDAAGDAYMWKDIEIYEYVICWQNADGTVDIRWTVSGNTENNEFMTTDTTNSEKITNNDLVYVMCNDGTIEITSYIGNESEVVIPAEIDGYAVKIGERAFYNLDDLRKVIISDGVLSIGDNAFESCDNLQTIVIPGSVTVIGEWAFGQSGVKSVTLNGCAKIGRKAFYNCDYLEELIITDGVSYIGENAFESCNSLQSVTIPDSVLVVGEWAFGQSGAKSVILNGCAEISKKAFYNCDNLAELTIADGVISIGENAFESCDNLQSVTIPGSVVTVGEWAFGQSGIKSVILNGCNEIGRKAFYNCDSLEELIITDGVATVGENAFESCDCLHSVIIESNNVSIAENAFAYCDQLKEAP